MHIVKVLLSHKEVAGPKDRAVRECFSHQSSCSNLDLHAESMNPLLAFAEIVDMISLEPLLRHLNLRIRKLFGATVFD
jgi:hypothetical protein